MIAFHFFNYFLDTVTKREEKDILAFTEKRLLELQGLYEGKNLVLKDFPIGKDEFVHTAIIGDPSKPPLLFLHGFLGTLVYYCKLFYDLSKEFCIYTFDFPGAGLSSRNNFWPQSNSEVLDYFMDQMGKIKKALGLTKFYLAGHSMGAYLSYYYCLKNPEDVICFFMLSPAGFRDVDPDHPFVKSLKHPQSLKVRLVNNLHFFLHRRNLNYRDFLSFLGPVGRQIIRTVSRNYLRIPDGEELELMIEYTYHVSRLKTCWDKSVHLIFKDGPYSPNPMINHIQNFKNKCFIYFGYPYFPFRLVFYLNFLTEQRS